MIPGSAIRVKASACSDSAWQTRLLAADSVASKNVESKTGLRLVACALIWFFSLSATVAFAGEMTHEISFVTPWMDHHDLVEATLSRLEPVVDVRRYEIERDGGAKSIEWYPAFGAPDSVSLKGPMVILENVPASVLGRLTNSEGRALDEALETWVREGGFLLVIGGSPSISTYAGTTLASVIGFSPTGSPDTKRLKPTDASRSLIDGRKYAGLYVDRLHRVELTTARVMTKAGSDPFIIENRFGMGRVVTVLSGIQGKRIVEGPRDLREWFASAAWPEFLKEQVEAATQTSFKINPEPPPPPPRPLVSADAFDIRYFALGHRPFPFTLAAGEAFEFASRLRDLGFTSVVFATSARDREDLRSLREIANAGLRIVYYEQVTRKSPASRFMDAWSLPKRAKDLEGEDKGWDIHDPQFRSAPLRMLEGRNEVREFPLRGIQIIEEFPDGHAVGPTLEALLIEQGLDPKLPPSDPRWIEVQALRADQTAITLQQFREAGEQLFPGLPQSTYIPGSYWNVPHVYSYRLTALGAVVDEHLAPAYLYSSRNALAGRASVWRAATTAWATSRVSPSPNPHIAVYALGRPLTRKGFEPDMSVWRETAWNALAHGATGLAYWRLPQGEEPEGLSALHEELARMGPWISGARRTPAPVAVLGSWTSRSEGSDGQRANLAACMNAVPAALEVGFEDVDLVFEERLDLLTRETAAVVITAAPALATDAVEELVRFVREGGHVFIEPGSAIRSQPGGKPVDLAELSGHPKRVIPTPLLARCAASHATPKIAAKAWRDAIEALGIRPRVDSPGADSSAAIRGGSDLWHVYALNHGDEPARIDVRLGKHLSSRSWVDLRSSQGAEARSTTSVRTPTLVPPGEAAILVSSRRLADRILPSFVRDGTRSTLHVKAVDSKNVSVPDGYPIRLGFDPITRCPNLRPTSQVFIEGKVEIELDCDLRTVREVFVRATDPLTGREEVIKTEVRNTPG